MSIDDVEKILEETKEAVDYQRVTFFSFGEIKFKLLVISLESFF